MCDRSWKGGKTLNVDLEDVKSGQLTVLTKDYTTHSQKQTQTQTHTHTHTHTPHTHIRTHAPTHTHTDCLMKISVNFSLFRR
jgi:hypothetical protein